VQVLSRDENHVVQCSQWSHNDITDSKLLRGTTISSAPLTIRASAAEVLDLALRHHLFCKVGRNDDCVFRDIAAFKSRNHKRKEIKTYPLRLAGQLSEILRSFKCLPRTVSGSTCHGPKPVFEEEPWHSCLSTPLEGGVPWAWCERKDSTRYSIGPTDRLNEHKTTQRHDYITVRRLKSPNWASRPCYSIWRHARVMTTVAPFRTPRTSPWVLQSSFPGLNMD